MIFIQLAILLICIFIGARMSGIGLGVMGMIGLLILLFVFGIQPSDPPLEVMLIIMSVVTAAAALAGSRRNGLPGETWPEKYSGAVPGR